MEERLDKIVEWQDEKQKIEAQISFDELTCGEIPIVQDEIDNLSQ